MFFRGKSCGSVHVVIFEICYASVVKVEIHKLLVHITESRKLFYAIASAFQKLHFMEGKGRRNDLSWVVSPH